VARLHPLLVFEAAASVQGWSAIDDAVMGGVSSSRLRHDAEGFAVFEGRVSLANGGGFASVRLSAPALGIAGAQVYVLALCGDGHRYKLNLRTDDAFDGIHYQATLLPPADAWTTLRLPVAAFVPTFRGRRVPGAPPLDPSRVRQVGLMIAEPQVGPFALALRSLHAELAPGSGSD
jgi:hypothetical protein